MLKKLLDKKINFIKKNVDPCGILIVGSLARTYSDKLDLKKTDVDVFVIVREGSFAREVVYEEGTEFDVSYITLDELNFALKDKIPSIISVIGTAKAIFLEEDCRELVGAIEAAYKEGPDEISNYYINYKRFNLTKFFEQLEKKVGKEEFGFLSNLFLKEVLTFYYELSRIWIPPDKKLIKNIEDKTVSEITRSFINGEDEDKVKRLKLLSNLLDAVFDPIGGRLGEWKKGSYPFDFK